MVIHSWLLGNLSPWRALQWASADWMAVASLGRWPALTIACAAPGAPLECPQAIRPCAVCLTSSPASASMTSPDLTWAQTAVQVGLNLMALFLGDVSAANVPVLRTLRYEWDRDRLPAFFLWLRVVHLLSITRPRLLIPTVLFQTTCISPVDSHLLMASRCAKLSPPTIQRSGERVSMAAILGHRICSHRNHPRCSGVSCISGPGAPWLVAGPYRLFETPLRSPLPAAAILCGLADRPDAPGNEQQIFQLLSRDPGYCHLRRLRTAMRPTIAQNCHQTQPG